jgi:hypothetical protein
MGWITADIQGVHLLNHAGSADSFKTDMTQLPNAKIGILLFPNSESGGAFNETIRSYVFETLYQLPATALESGAAAYQRHKNTLRVLLASVTSLRVGRADVTTYLGI